MSARSLILGIDPGLTGAFCVLETSEKPHRILEVWDMPLLVRNNKNEIDVFKVGEKIGEYAERIRFAMIEEVGVMGGKESRTSMFNFGRNTGIVHGALGVYGIPIYFVRPAIWKALMGLSHKKSESLERAKILFPLAARFFSRAKDDGRAEAALLAVFGIERFG